MAFFDDKDSEVVVSAQTDNTTNRTGWLNVGAGNQYRVICTVLNLSGSLAAEELAVLNWSIQHKTNPDDATEAATDLIAASAFTTVEAGTTFPNQQIKQVGASGTASKEYIRAVWALAGTNPVATVKFQAQKSDFTGPGLVRIGGSVGEAL